MCLETTLSDINKTSTYVPFIDKQNNVPQQELIRAIAETADTYTKFTLMNNVIILIPDVKTNNNPLQVRTIKEVSDMDKKIIIKNIYRYVISINLVLVALSLTFLCFNLFKLPIEILIGTIIFASIGAICFSVDALDFYKRNKKDIIAYEKARS